MSALYWSRKGLEDSDLLKKLYDVRNDSQHEKLELSFNNLTSLPDLRTFRQFDNLKVLNLMCNNMDYIDFSIIPPTVTRLELGHNKLTRAGNLSQCRELEYLDVGYNHITDIDWRNLPPTMTRIYLGKNQLTTVRDVSQCTRLSELWVEDNHINHVDWRNLPPALTRFELQNNQLTTADLCYCTQLQWLNLDNNPTLHSILSLPNKHFDFYTSSSVKFLSRKCFHENTYSMLKEKCTKLKWNLQQPPVEVLLQGLEAVLEYYKEESIRTTHTR